MNKFVNAILYIFLTLLILFNYNGDVKFAPWFVTCAISGLIWAFWVGKQLGSAAAMASAYFLLSGLWVFSWVAGDLDKYSVPTLMSLYRHSSYSTLIMVLLVSMAAALRVEALKKIVNYFGVIAAIDALLVIFQFAVRRDGFISGGFLFNSSMNACFMAVFFPILNQRLRTGWPKGLHWSVTALAIICSHSAMGVGVFGVVSVMVYRRFLKHAIFGGIILAASAYLTQGASLFSSTGRVNKWTQFLSWHYENASTWFGTGSGTFYVWSPNIEITDGTFNPKHAWLWMHNDWAQFYFEGGAMGLALILFLYGTILWRAKYTLKPSIIGLGLVCLANYPFHDARFSLAAVALLSYSLKDWFDSVKINLDMGSLANLFGHFKSHIG